MHEGVDNLRKENFQKGKYRADVDSARTRRRLENDESRIDRSGEYGFGNGQEYASKRL